MDMTSGQRGPMRFEDELLPVLTAALAERQETQIPVSTPRKRRRPAWAIAVPIAAAVLGLVLVVPIVLPSGPGGADPAAAVALHRVALRAAQQPPGSSPHPGQYVYTRSEVTGTGLYVTGSEVPNFFFVTTFTREAWIGTDGSGRIIDTVREIAFPTEQDSAAWIAAGSPDLEGGTASDEVYPVGGLYYLDTSELPADPEALRELIERREIVGGPEGDWETFTIVGDLLRETSTAPAVRGALFEVAADLPGVEYVGKVKDASGRPGVAVAYTHEGVRHELIFHPRTAELLGESDLLVEDSTVDVESGGPGAIYGGVGPAGTRAYTATYSLSGITDSTAERP